MDKTAVYELVGGNIRRERKRLRINQDELAEKIGVGRTSVTNLETGRQGLLVHQLIKIANELGVKPSALIDIDFDALRSGTPRQSLPTDLAAIVDGLQRKAGM